jgi:hypothetical protein
MVKCKSIGQILTSLKLWFLSCFCHSDRIDLQTRLITNNLLAIQHSDPAQLEKVAELLIEYGYIYNDEVRLPIKSETKHQLLRCLKQDNFNTNTFD